ncbi:MAG: hypothetical protein R3B51_13765 [Thermodesulfobacteriota bacterium]
MHGLGIPTTRALSIVGSDERVERETTERGRCCSGWRRRMSGSARSRDFITRAGRIT